MGDTTTGGDLSGDSPSGGGGFSPASGLSLAGLGFKLGGDYLGAEGTANADTYKAELLDRAAEYGELKAAQTNAQLTRNLTMTLGNIDAVRAAAKTDPTSPTGAAVRDFVGGTLTEQKNIKVDSIMAQAKEDEANAAYLRDASSKALLGGDLKMGGDILSAVGPLLAIGPLSAIGV